MLVALLFEKLLGLLLSNDEVLEVTTTSSITAREGDFIVEFSFFSEGLEATGFFTLGLLEVSTLELIIFSCIILQNGLRIMKQYAYYSIAQNGSQLKKMATQQYIVSGKN